MQQQQQQMPYPLLQDLFEQQLYATLALFVSSQEGELDAIRMDNRKTILHECAKRNLLFLTTHCLRNGANTNAMDENNRTPLHYAAESGSEDICKLLVRHGGTINAQDVDGYTPLMLALENDHYPTALALLRLGAHVDKPGKFGNTALHMFKQDPAKAKLLLNFGADPLVKNAYGQACLLEEHIIVKQHS